LQQHIQTLVGDNARWQTLIANDLLWELAYAPAIGHPARLTGREEVMRHVNWFLGTVENFRFLDIRVYAFADAEAAVAEFKAEGSSSLRDESIARIMWCSCVLQAGRLFVFAVPGP